MDPKDTECVTLLKELSLKDLAQGAEFQIDVDFKDKKKKNDVLLMDRDELMNEEYMMNQDASDDSDVEDVLRGIEESAELDMLASPEYSGFDELASKMIDCIPSGEVKMMILEEGAGELVPPDSDVTIHYAAYWEGERLPFDCTLFTNYRKPQIFSLGKGELLSGLEIGLTMVKGPTARVHLLVEPRYAWGPLGVPPRIRPQRCLFTVSLLAVRDLATLKYFNELPSEKQKSFETTLKFVSASSQKAKNFFKRKLYKKALSTYLKSLSVIEMSNPENETQLEELKKQKSVVYLNLAVCYTKLELPNKVFLMLGYLSKVTDVNAHAKAQYYFGKAHIMLGEYSDALKYYKKALKLEPKNLEIGHAMAELDALIKKDKRTEKELWRGAFKNKVDDKIEVQDEDFLLNIKMTCEDLSQRNVFTKFDLPQGLTKLEVMCIKDVVKGFDGLIVDENGEGSKKRISLVKTV